MIRGIPNARPAWVEIAGFKSICKPARVDIKPITLLAGANSSGKSSIFQPLLLLKQSLEVPYDPDPLYLDGPHITFTSLDQILSRGRAKRTQVQRFEISFGHLLGRTKGPRLDSKLSFRRTGSSSQPRLAAKTAVRPSGEKRWVEVTSNNEVEIAGMLDADIENDDIFFSKGPLINDMRVFRKRSRSVPLQALPFRTIMDWLQAILHLPGHRGHRKRRYPQTKATKARRGGFSVVGPMHHYAASLLGEWRKLAQKEESNVAGSTAQAKLKRVNDGLRSLGLTWKVHAESANAAELALRVGRVPEPQQGGAHDLVDIADVGFGLSQVLPVIVALAGAVPGQLVLIEQPELHLHPRAQLAMGGLLADAANRGVVVVLETHSQLILRALQTIVAKRVLLPDQVGLHWFTRDPDTGWSTVTRAQLRKDGTFGAWPVDFPDVFAMADNEFIEAVFSSGAVL